VIKYTAFDKCADLDTVVTTDNRLSWTVSYDADGDGDAVGFVVGGTFVTQSKSNNMCHLQ